MDNFRDHSNIRVAFGAVKITPPESLGGVIGRPMAGYTPVPRVKEVYDDIYARVVLIETTVLNNVSKRVALISTDFVQIPLLFCDYIKEKIEEKHHINKNQILIHATHTHKSMDTTGVFTLGGSWPGVLKGIIVGSFRGDDKYKVWIAREITKLFGDLIDRLEPAEIAWKRVVPGENLAVNRRHFYVTDQRLGIIAFRNRISKELIGAVVNFGAHPTILNHRDKGLSAEFPGVIVKSLAKMLGKKDSVVFFNAAAGDVAPNYGVPGFRYTIRKDNGKIFRRSRYSYVKYYGNYLAKKFNDIISQLTDLDYYDSLDTKTYVRTFWVPMKDFKKYKPNMKTHIVNRLFHVLKRYILFLLAFVMGDEVEPNFPGFAAKRDKTKNFLRTTINTYSMIQYMEFEVWRSEDTEESENSEVHGESETHGESGFEKSSENEEKSSRSKKMSITAVPGELFLDIANRIYKETPTGAENSFIFQASNDWIAYLFPIDEYINYGGYEPVASFGPLCGTYVYLNFKQLMEDIKIRTIAGFY